MNQGLVSTTFPRPTQGAMAGLPFATSIPMQPRYAAMRVKWPSAPCWLPSRTETMRMP